MSVILRPDFPKSHTTSGPAAFLDDDCDFPNCDCSRVCKANPATHLVDPKPRAVSTDGDPHLLVDLLLANIDAMLHRVCARAINHIGTSDFPLGINKTLHYQECLREIYQDALSRLKMMQDDIHDDIDKYNREDR